MVAAIGPLTVYLLVVEALVGGRPAQAVSFAQLARHG